MTVEASAPKSGPYSGNDVTATFSFDFKVFAKSEVRVVRLTTASGAETELVLDSDFRVTLNTNQNDDPGGTVTYIVDDVSTPFPSGYQLVIGAVFDYEQPTDIANGGAFLAEVVENGLDRTVMQIKQVAEQMDRSLRVPFSDDLPTSYLEIPTRVARQGKFLAFDGAGAPVASSGTGADDGLREDLAADDGASLVNFNGGEDDEVDTTIFNIIKTRRTPERFGAIGDGVTNDLAALQAAVDSVPGARVFIPNGVCLINGTLYLNDDNVLEFESPQAIIRGNNLTGGALIAGKNPLGARTFRARLMNGTLDNQSRANANSILIDFLSMSDAVIDGMRLQKCAKGFRNGGAGSLGAYWNTIRDCIFTEVNTGTDSGSAGNDLRVYHSRFVDVVDGTVDNDNSGGVYDGCSVETFTGAAHKAGMTTTVQGVRYKPLRIENPAGSPAHAAAIGFQLGFSDTVRCDDWHIEHARLVNVATNYAIHADSLGNEISAQRWRLDSGTALRRAYCVEVTKDIASLAAGEFRQESFTVTGLAVGDAVHASPPAAWPNNVMAGSAWVSATDTVSVPLHNPSGGAVDPPSGAWQFFAVRKA